MPDFDMTHSISETGNENNFRMKSVSDPIATANPKVAPMPDSSMTLPTLPDVRLLPELKIAANKPEVEVTFERTELATRYQRLT